MTEDERILRELLWLNHGHMGLYGDDGEMQCGICCLDFKRDSAKKIKDEFERQGIEQLAQMWRGTAEFVGGMNKAQKATEGSTTRFANRITGGELPGEKKGME